MEQKKLTFGQRFKKWYENLPEQKKYFEFFSAILGIPVLLTVLILNYNNLKNNDDRDTPPPVQNGKQVITVIPVTQDAQATPTPTNTPECKHEVGPVTITAPAENETLTQSPVCFNVEYKDNNYCSVVWRYRIDNGSWSDYSDKSVCLYNLTNGPHKFELNVKSVVSNDQTDLVRNFNYQGPVQVTPTLTPTTTP